MISGTALVIPLIVDGVKKTVKNGSSGSNFAGVHRELFWKATDKEVKVLTEVKGNTKTLAMVLRSERELLSLNSNIPKPLVTARLVSSCAASPSAASSYTDVEFAFSPGRPLRLKSARLAAAVTTSSSLPGRGFDLTAAVHASSVPATGLT